MPNVVEIRARQQRPRKPGSKIVVIAEHEPGNVELDRYGVPEPVSAVGVGNWCARAPRTPDEDIGGYHAIVDGGLHKFRTWEQQQAEIIRQSQLEPETLFNLATVVRGAPVENRVNGSGSPKHLPVTANENGLHICYADYSPAALEAGARITALWCVQFGISTNRRFEKEWPASGLYDHDEIPKPNTHTDRRVFPQAAWDMRFARALAPRPLLPPRFSPPREMVDRLLDKKGLCVAILLANGRVFAYGVPYDIKNRKRSEPYGNAYFVGRTASRIEWPNADEKRAGYRYVVIATSKERYGQSKGL